MDKKLIRKRFARAVPTYSKQATVQQQIAGKMARMINRYLPQSAHRNVLEVGCGTGLFTRSYLSRVQPDHLCLNDICPEVATCFDDLPTDKVCFLPGDAEQLDFPGGQSLITSCSALQWFESPERFFQRCSQILVPGGYFSFSTFGKQNLKEISTLTGCGLPYLSLEELKKELDKKYQIIYSKEELVQLSFESPTDILKHLKETGVTGIRRQQWTRSTLADFCTRYQDAYGRADRTVPLTYHPIYIIAKRKIS